MMRMVMVMMVLAVTTAFSSDEALLKALQQQQEEEQQRHGELWAVLLAGSNEWMNYRHQADVCHAYQILHQHGVPDEHIIVMMYDDIAFNTENPTPGVIINRPGGPNVYEGVPKDYVGGSVTPEVFLKVLSGDAQGLEELGSGKVVRSGPNDRIFVNMVDHGAPGIFAFPDDVLNATDLLNTIMAMRLDRKFAKMVLYMEACESGSMFQNLPHDLQVYALSASSPHQPSYACYEDTDLEVYLGDVFSVKWMEDTDWENLHQETLKEQFLLVRNEVTTSTVMHWGELRMAHQKLYRFFGSRRPHQGSHYSNSLFTPRVASRPKEEDPCLNSSVPSYDVPMAILKSKIQRASSTAELIRLKKKMTSMKMNRLFAKRIMQNIVQEVTGDRDLMREMMTTDHYHSISRWACHGASVRALHNNCFHLAKSPYVLRLVYTLVNLCEHGYTAEQFEKATKKVCVGNRILGVE